jgi:hypothetical protein
MAEVKFEILQNLGVLSQGSRGWQKEVNIVSWNGRPPKVDIRDWDADHQRMGKGVTLNREEVEALGKLLQNLELEDSEVE